MNNTTKIQEIMALAIRLTQSGTKQVFVNYSGHIDTVSVEVFEAESKWCGAPYPKAEFSKDVHLEWQDELSEKLEEIRKHLDGLIAKEAAA